MSKKDFYEVLEVSPKATAAEIKRAYRRLAMKYHPDRNAGDKPSEQKFKEIQEAYSVLSNPEKRASYDQWGHQAFGPQGHAQEGDFHGFDFASFFGESGGFGFRELFRQMTGNPSPGAGQPGQDVRLQLQISLEEVLSGVERELEFRLPSHCSSCQATGSQGGKPPETCSTCRGRGEVQANQFFYTQCPACGGAGKKISDPCKSCRGEGLVQKNRKLKVQIPPGIKEGSLIKYAKKGADGSQGQSSGDLYLEVSVKPHPVFMRQGDNLICEVPVPVTMALIGGTIEVPLLEGGVGKLHIPEGCQPGALLRVRGKGLPQDRGKKHFGDLICKLNLEVPTGLTEEQKQKISSVHQQIFCQEKKGSFPYFWKFIEKIQSTFNKK